MKIRLQITLWMIGTGCLGMLVFLLFVLHEVNEIYTSAYTSKTKIQTSLIQSQQEIAEEIAELQTVMLWGLLCALAVLGGSSYWVAARILKPVREINELSHEITTEQLNRRIPLPRSRDELYDLTVSLNQMFARLERGIKQQHQFLSDASHELKTPTAMLRLFLEQLSHSADFPESEQSRLDLQMQGIYRMERLIKQLLELSVIESRDSLPTESVDLSALLKQLVSEFEPLIEAQCLRLEKEISTGIIIQGQAESLRKMLIALFENAITYNLAGGQIRLKLSSERDQIKLILGNTGPGIPAENLPHVFERFYRVDKSRTAIESGSGLGLSIVQEIVRLHQGQIKLSSTPNQYTQFELLFALKSA
jgi:two-component system, OmpR family, sensor kinase